MNQIIFEEETLTGLVAQIPKEALDNYKDMSPEKKDKYFQRLFNNTYEDHKTDEKIINFINEKKKTTNSNIDIIFIIDNGPLMQTEKYEKYVKVIIQQVLRQAGNFYDFESYKEVQKSEFLNTMIIKYDITACKYNKSELVSYGKIMENLHELLNLQTEDTEQSPSYISYSVLNDLSCTEFRKDSDKFVVHFLYDHELRLPQGEDEDEDLLINIRDKQFDYTLINFNSHVEVDNIPFLQGLSQYVQMETNSVVL
jgi:hypothetical protein